MKRALGSSNQVRGCPGWYYGLRVRQDDGSVVFDVHRDDDKGLRKIEGLHASGYRTTELAERMGEHELRGYEHVAREAIQALEREETDRDGYGWITRQSKSSRWVWTWSRENADGARNAGWEVVEVADAATLTTAMDALQEIADIAAAPGFASRSGEPSEALEVIREIASRTVGSA